MRSVLGSIGMVWAHFASSMFPYCSRDLGGARQRAGAHESRHLYQGIDSRSKSRASAHESSGIRHAPGLGDHRNVPGRNQRRQSEQARIESPDRRRKCKKI
jgi:hypothetical protein